MGKSKKASTHGEASKTKSGDAALELANGFLAVPLAIPHSTARHWLYVRQHTASQTASSSRLDQLPADRTLFLANLPVDADEEWVRQVFGKVGGVSSVKFRRQAVADEEDEREMVGEGESGSEGEEDEQHLAPAEPKGGKKKKGKQQERKSRVPKVTPLPSLDPRTAAGGTAFLATASSAHVVFLDGLTLTRAMDLLRKGTRWPSSKPTAPVGLGFLLAQHALSRPPLPAIAAWANSSIALHTYRVAHPAPRRIGVRGVTLGPSGELLDEDGFIIVQRSSSSKYGRVGASAEAGGSVGIAKGTYVEGKNGKRKSEGLQDFYRFQLRERKRDELKELRVKFERDRAKVAKLKEGRRFKPY